MIEYLKINKISAENISKDFTFVQMMLQHHLKINFSLMPVQSLIDNRATLYNIRT